MEIDKILQIIYYDPKHPASFSTADKLYSSAKKIIPNLNISQVKDWLSGEFTYTLHKPIRKKFTRNPIIVEDVDQQWEADLVDMQEFKRMNKGYTFMLTVIDILSKYAWAIPLKNKTGVEIVRAFRIIFKDDRKPFYLRTDRGKEFLNRSFQNFLKENNVYHFTSKNQDIKCAVVERFNRTLKSRMYKYFTSKGTRKWYDVIDDIISAYNNSEHRSIKMTPIEALSTDSKILYKNVYSKINNYELKFKDKEKLEIGENVRKKYNLGPFDKSFYPNWTDEIFKIEKKTDDSVKPLYNIKDGRDNVSEIRYYPEELQRVKENLYRVEKIIKTRIIDGKKQSLIKWLNYPSSYNSWVEESDILKL